MDIQISIILFFMIISMIGILKVDLIMRSKNLIKQK